VFEYVSMKLISRKIDRNRRLWPWDSAAELKTAEEQAEFLKASRTHHRDCPGRVPASYLFDALRIVMRARGLHPRRPKGHMGG
jgi:hypothetical protein